LAQAIVNDLSGIELATRLIEKQALIGYNNNYFNESRIAAVDSNFLQIFDFKITRGNPVEALTAPNAVVISENMAGKYFAGLDPIGKELAVVNNGKKRFFTVSGIMENCPENSSLSYDFFLPMTAFPETNSGNWNNLSVNTFLLLRDGVRQSAIDQEFPKLVKKYIGNNKPEFDKWLASGNKFRFSLQPLTKVHLYSRLEADYAQNGNIIVIYILCIIAFLVITISTINYINLSNIRLCRSWKKTGILKILGATQSHLIAGNILLSVIVCLFSLILAILVTGSVMPVFQNLFGKQEIFVLSHFKHISVIFFIALCIGMVSGLISSIRKPVGKSGNLLAFSTSKAESIRGERGFVIFQNVLSICLIIASIVIFKQTKLLQNKELGYNSSNLLVVNNALPVNDKLEVFKQTLAKNPNIQDISVSDYIPSREVSNYYTLHFQNDQAKYDFSLSGFSTDEQFLKTYQIAVSEGKFFGPISESGSECVMNYAAINQFGIKDPIGKVVWWGDKEYRISGIIPDFNYESLRNGVRPLIIRKLDPNPRNLYVTIRCSDEEMKSTIAYVGQTWKNIAGDIPFEYNFLDKNLALLYGKEKTFSELISIFSFLSIVIACLGIFGLSSFASILRTKEIGVRKVNGARVFELLAMLNKNFVKWVAIAFVIATPIAYYAMHKWLQNFAYKTELSWWIFAMAGLLALGIALLTVSWQSWKAATRNPVEALRYE
jgi:putative ABC transport system permease protein